MTVNRAMQATTWLLVGMYEKLEVMETAARSIWLEAYSVAALPGTVQTRLMYPDIQHRIGTWSSGARNFKVKYIAPELG